VKSAGVSIRCGMQMSSMSLRLFSVVVLLAGCKPPVFQSPPPLDRLYFPAGVSHVSFQKAGVLVVADANFDKRFSSGSLVAIDLNTVDLPPLGGDLDANGAVAPRSLTNLNLGERNRVFISSFAGEMAALQMNDVRHRFYVPTRSEGMKLNAAELSISSGSPVLKCHPASDSNDCSLSAPSLSPNAFEQSAEGVPRAPAPYGAAVAPRRCSTKADCVTSNATCVLSRCITSEGAPEADVLVTHLSQADSPFASQQNFRGYLVKLDSETLDVNLNSFLGMGAGASNSVAPGARWNYVSGRFNPAIAAPNVLRLVASEGTVITSGIETYFGIADTRGLALSPDETRLYLAARVPDVLMIMGISEPLSDLPLVTPIRTVSIPSQATEVKVIPRAGKSPLVAITCTGADVLAIYDDEAGRVVAQIPVGNQPFGLGIQLSQSAARIFVSNFGDGRISVIDIPDLNKPQNARTVAWLGTKQNCLTQGQAAAGCGGTR
jgi:hypothetical protein